jgi:hypothetical protein
MNRRELLKNAAILLGGMSSASVVNAFLNGVDGRINIVTQRFSISQKKMTAALAEMIIPRTDTPGAIDAGVPHFIELMVSDWYTDRERKIYFDGLSLLNVFCHKQYKADFLNATPEQKIKALEYAEHDSEAYTPVKSKNPLSKDEDEDKPFFMKLKELTVLGYYSSEEGATEELKYNPMPMRYGDIDLVDVGRQWSS